MSHFHAVSAARPEALVGESAAPLPERELARGVARGEPESLGVAYDQYAASLYPVLCAMLGSAADAEDALQEVFARLATGRAREMRDLKAYLFTAARNEALSILRRRRRDGLLCVFLPRSKPPEPPAVRPDLGLVALLQRLPAAQREVVALKVFEEMTFAEIAALAGISPNTAAARYRYGIGKLRAWCDEEDEDER